MNYKEIAESAVLAKNSEFANETSRDKLIRETTDYLLYVLGRLKDCPAEPDVAALMSDPFLSGCLESFTLLFPCI